MRIISSPIASNKLETGEVLYAKIHGMKANVAAGATHIFNFSIPYDKCLFSGAEILKDIESVSEFKINHPIAGLIEQYGFSVNMGRIIYVRESAYMAELPKDLIISCEVTNDTVDENGNLIAAELGVNFILHEVRPPEVT